MQARAWSRAKPIRQHAGFTYLLILLAVAVMGFGTAAVGTFWHQVQQREKERELLAIGAEFRRAIGEYVRATPAGRPRYPHALDDLLRDPRVPGIARHLRRIPRDPMTGKAEWGLVPAPDGGIMGVHSLSTAEPIKRANFLPADASFEGKGAYAEWTFVFAPRTPPARESARGAAPPAPARAPARP